MGKAKDTGKMYDATFITVLSCVLSSIVPIPDLTFEEMTL